MHVVQLYCHGLPTQIIAFVAIDFLYLLFHATFDRGVKVRLFCSPRCACAFLKYFSVEADHCGEQKVALSGLGKTRMKK